MCVIALAQQRFLSATAPSKSSAAAYSSMSRLRDIIAPPRNYCICGIRNYLEQNRTTARHVFVHLLRRQWNWLCGCLMIEQSLSQRARPTGGLCGSPQNAPLAPLTQFPKLLSPPHTTHKHFWVLVVVDKNIRPRRSELELGSKLLLLLLLSPVEITGWNSFTWGWMDDCVVCELDITTLHTCQHSPLRDSQLIAQGSSFLSITAKVVVVV